MYDEDSDDEETHAPVRPLIDVLGVKKIAIEQTQGDGWLEVDDNNDEENRKNLRKSSTKNATDTDNVLKERERSWRVGGGRNVMEIMENQNINSANKENDDPNFGDISQIRETRAVSDSAEFQDLFGASPEKPKRDFQKENIENVKNKNIIQGNWYGNKAGSEDVTMRIFESPGCSNAEGESGVNIMTGSESGGNNANGNDVHQTTTTAPTPREEATIPFAVPRRVVGRRDNLWEADPIETKRLQRDLKMAQKKTDAIQMKIESLLDKYDTNIARKNQEADFPNGCDNHEKDIRTKGGSYGSSKLNQAEIAEADVNIDTSDRNTPRQVRFQDNISEIGHESEPSVYSTTSSNTSSISAVKQNRLSSYRWTRGADKLGVEAETRTVVDGMAEALPDGKCSDRGIKQKKQTLPEEPDANFLNNIEEYDEVEEYADGSAEKESQSLDQIARQKVKSELAERRRLRNEKVIERYKSYHKKDNVDSSQNDHDASTDNGLESSTTTASTESTHEVDDPSNLFLVADRVKSTRKKRLKEAGKGERTGDGVTQKRNQRIEEQKLQNGDSEKENTDANHANVNDEDPAGIDPDFIPEIIGNRLEVPAKKSARKRHENSNDGNQGEESDTLNDDESDTFNDESSSSSAGPYLGGSLVLQGRAVDEEDREEEEMLRKLRGDREARERELEVLEASVKKHELTEFLARIRQGVRGNNPVNLTPRNENVQNEEGILGEIREVQEDNEEDPEDLENTNANNIQLTNPYTTNRPYRNEHQPFDPNSILFEKEHELKEERRLQQIRDQETLEAEQRKKPVLESTKFLQKFREKQEKPQLHSSKFLEMHRIRKGLGEKEEVGGNSSGSGNRSGSGPSGTSSTNHDGLQNLVSKYLDGDSASLLQSKATSSSIAIPRSRETELPAGVHPHGFLPPRSYITSKNSVPLPEWQSSSAAGSSSDPSSSSSSSSYNPTSNPSSISPSASPTLSSKFSGEHDRDSGTLSSRNQNRDLTKSSPAFGRFDNNGLTHNANDRDSPASFADIDVFDIKNTDRLDSITSPNICVSDSLPEMQLSITDCLRTDPGTAIPTKISPTAHLPDNDYQDSSCPLTGARMNQVNQNNATNFDWLDELKGLKKSRSVVREATKICEDDLKKERRETLAWRKRLEEKEQEFRNQTAEKRKLEREKRKEGMMGMNRNRPATGGSAAAAVDAGSRHPKATLEAEMNSERLNHPADGAASSEQPDSAWQYQPGEEDLSQQNGDLWDKVENVLDSNQMFDEGRHDNVTPAINTTTARPRSRGRSASRGRENQNVARTRSAGRNRSISRPATAIDANSGSTTNIGNNTAEVSAALLHAAASDMTSHQIDGMLTEAEDRIRELEAFRVHVRQQRSLETHHVRSGGLNTRVDRTNHGLFGPLLPNAPETHIGGPLSQANAAEAMEIHQNNLRHSRSRSTINNNGGSILGSNAGPSGAGAAGRSINGRIRRQNLDQLIESQIGRFPLGQIPVGSGITSANSNLNNIHSHVPTSIRTLLREGFHPHAVAAMAAWDDGEDDNFNSEENQLIHLTELLSKLNTFTVSKKDALRAAATRNTAKKVLRGEDAECGAEVTPKAEDTTEDGDEGGEKNSDANGEEPSTGSSNSRSRSKSAEKNKPLRRPIPNHAIPDYSSQANPTIRSNLPAEAKSAAERDVEDRILIAADCAICLESIGCGDEVTVLRCNGRHSFHAECIKSWILKNPKNARPTCPMCKDVIR